MPLSQPLVKPRRHTGRFAGEGTLEHGARLNRVRVEPGLVVPGAWALKLDQPGVRISVVELPNPTLPEFG